MSRRSPLRWARPCTSAISSKDIPICYCRCLPETMMCALLKMDWSRAVYFLMSPYGRTFPRCVAALSQVLALSLRHPWDLQRSWPRFRCLSYPSAWMTWTQVRPIDCGHKQCLINPDWDYSYLEGFGRGCRCPLRGAHALSSCATSCVCSGTRS